MRPFTVARVPARRPPPVTTNGRVHRSVGFNNPDVPWSRLEAVLSGRPSQPAVVDPLAASGDGGDSPAWSRKRTGYAAPELVRGTSTVDYVELHCHTNFSFLDGASHPEELVEEAYQLGLAGLAVTDHDGLYGVVRFAGAAERDAGPGRAAPARPGPRTGRLRGAVPGDLPRAVGRG